MQPLVEKVENCHEKILIGDVDVQEYCEGLENPYGCELMRSVALLDELKENFILQLLRSRLAESDHILDQPKHIVQLGLLPDPNDDLEDLERLVLIDLAHEGDALVQSAILRHQDILIVLGDADEVGSLPEDPLEELIHIEVDNFVEQVNWSLFNHEIAIFAVRREELLFVASDLQLILL